ncbi:unnamed protein product [Calicophoron daubneyi]|uniref:Uncharacterized protein n=1 Tax=Calicophoron daubneyi TaxID=300641 RepID=A0AAV2THQ2_CALDB
MEKQNNERVLHSAECPLYCPEQFQGLNVSHPRFVNEPIYSQRRSTNILKLETMKKIQEIPRPLQEFKELPARDKNVRANARQLKGSPKTNNENNSIFEIVPEGQHYHTTSPTTSFSYFKVNPTSHFGTFGPHQTKVNEKRIIQDKNVFCYSNNEPHLTENPDDLGNMHPNEALGTQILRSQSTENISSANEFCPYRRQTTVEQYQPVSSPTDEKRGCQKSVSQVPLVPIGCAMNQSFDMDPPLIIQHKSDETGFQPEQQEIYLPSGQYVEQNHRFPNSLKFCRRLALFIVCLIVLTCLSYRLIDWHNRYQAMKAYFIYVSESRSTDKIMAYEEGRNSSINLISHVPNFSPDGSSASDRQADSSNVLWSSTPAPHLVITICNLNPVRGSSLFAVENGSQIYDFILRKRQNELEMPQTANEFDQNPTLISIDLLSRTGHRIEEMLKSCRFGDHIYTSENYSTMLTPYGLCYLLNLDYDVSELKCLLDPQEYDYLIPNHGLSGFRVWIHTSEAQAREALQVDYTRAYVSLDRAKPHYGGIGPNEVTVGSEFQTVFRVAVGMDLLIRSAMLDGKTCPPPYACSDSEQPGHSSLRLKQKMGPEDLKHQEKFRQSLPFRTAPAMNVRIISSTQASKPILRYNLLALRNPVLFRRNPIKVAWGLHVQQRAFLRLANQTAFAEVEKLVSEFGELQNGLEKTISQLHMIQSSSWADERELLQKQNRREKCGQDLLEYIKVLSNLTINFYEDLCHLPATDKLFTGAILRCNKNRTKSSTKSNKEKNFLKAVLLAKNQVRYHGKSGVPSQQKSGYPHGPENLSLPDYTTQGLQMEDYMMTCQKSLLQLQVIHLFFAQQPSGTQLKDVLRNYLRILSAKRMQLRPGSSDPTHLRLPLSNSDPTTSSDGLNEEIFNIPFNPDVCTNSMQQRISKKYHAFLMQIGEGIAGCLQRLQIFVDSMNSIVLANRPIAEAFQLEETDLSHIPHSSLVSFTMQIETAGGDISDHRMISLDNLFNPLSDILGICFSTLGLLVPVLLLIDYGFNKVHRRRVTIGNKR